MFEKWLIPAIATLLFFVFFVTGALLPWLFTLSAGMAPCAPQSWLYRYSPIIVEIALIVSCVCMYRMMWKPRVLEFVLAAAAPVLLGGCFLMMNQSDVDVQSRCRAEVRG